MTHKIEHDYLQGFLNTGEQLRTQGSAFTRQRSLVRTQHRPLLKSLQMVGKEKPVVFGPGALYCNRTATQLVGGLSQRFLQGLRGLFLHVGQEVEVDVQGDAYGEMP
jgi:hypothetical protein